MVLVMESYKSTQYQQYMGNYLLYDILVCGTVKNHKHAAGVDLGFLEGLLQGTNLLGRDVPACFACWNKSMLEQGGLGACPPSPPRKIFFKYCNLETFPLTITPADIIYTATACVKGGR